MNLQCTSYVDIPICWKTPEEMMDSVDVCNVYNGVCFLLASLKREDKSILW